MERRLNTFADVEAALRPYIPLVKELTGKNTVLDRILPLMEYLGHPENNLKTIHIAGTSGKTSTSYYIASLLTLSGQNVGLTISPHIDRINERTQINGQPLEEQAFARELSEFLETVDRSSIRPSYFELIYAFSIWVFAKLKVDYAVIETGVGGLYDATNVVTREDKIAVITDIGFDHMKLLGNTLGEIASQKVGIVHKNNALLMYQQSREIMSIIEAWVKKESAQLYLTDQESEERLYGISNAFKSLPDFQKRNWLLAYRVYRYVAARDGLKELSAHKLSESQQVNVPARMDTSTVQDHLLVMDGAHNQQKMSAFIASYRHLYPGSKPTILIAFKSDKAYQKTLPEIRDLASSIIVSTFNTSQDLPVTSASPEEIARKLINIGAKNVTVERDNLKAYKKLLKSDSRELIITGSFYLIAQIRGKVKQ